MPHIKRYLRRCPGFEHIEDVANPLFGIALFLAASAVLIRLFFWWYTGRLWEDALIAALHSENFFSGLGLTHCHPGEPPVLGFTSPLGVFVMLIGDAFHVGFGLALIKIVSAFAAGITVLYAMAIATHPKVRLPGPLAVMCMGYLAFEHHQILWGMVGMETQLATLALTASFCLLIAERPVWLGGSLGLCMLARPDFAFWTVIVGLGVLLSRPRQLPKIVLVALAVYVPWVLFATFYYGSPIPNTIAAKSMGYPLWWTAPGISSAQILRNVWESVTGSYTVKSVFQPLGPSFGGHGTGFHPVFHDRGLICNAMILLGLFGSVAAFGKRQWIFLAPLAFIVVYGVYYIFFVPVVFGWYLMPYMAMAILLCARGLQIGETLLPSGRLRNAVFAALVAAYLACFVGVLPKTFATEKRIQDDVENKVRKQIGLFLGQVMAQDQGVGCECLGYFSYFSRKAVYDWPGLANRKVVEYSRTHPAQRTMMDMLQFTRPDFIVLRYVEYAASSDLTWLDDQYRVIASFEADTAKVRDFIREGEDIDLGFLVLAKRDWKGPEPGVKPEHARAHCCIAMRAMSQRDPNRALDHLDIAAAQGPCNPEVLSTYGLVYSATGQREKSVKYFVDAIQCDPTYVRAYNNLGVILLQEGNVDEALKTFLHAIDLDSDYVEVRLNAASVLAKLGRLDEALAQFKAALNCDPDSKDAAVGLKHVREAMKPRAK